MKKFNISLILIGLISFSNVYSDQMACQKAPCTKICDPEYDSRIMVGADYTHVQMKPRGQSSFSGNLGGLQGIYEYRPLDNFYAGVKLNWKQGNMSSSAGDRSLLYIDTQERLGYTFSLCQKMDRRISLFTGLGYRHLGQNFKPNSGSSVKFNYNEIYFPVGILSESYINSWFHIGCEFTWMPQVFPTLSIVPLKGNNWDLENQLTNFYVAVPLIFNLTCDNKWTLQLTPFYEYWNDGKTTAETAAGNPLGIPSNRYNFWGADLNCSYSF